MGNRAHIPGLAGRDGPAYIRRGSCSGGGAKRAKKLYAAAQLAQQREGDRADAIGEHLLSQYLVGGEHCLHGHDAAHGCRLREPRPTEQRLELALLGLLSSSPRLVVILRR